MILFLSKFANFKISNYKIKLNLNFIFVLFHDLIIHNCKINTIQFIPIIKFKNTSEHLMYSLMNISFYNYV